MADLNTVSITGRVTMEPELRNTRTGTPLINLRVVVNDAVRDDAEGWIQKPNFINVTVFGPNAENLARSLTKGSRIAVDGRLSWREWTTDSGTKGQALDIVANNVHYLDTKEQADARRSGSASQATSPVQSDTGDDVPF